MKKVFGFTLSLLISASAFAVGTTDWKAGDTFIYQGLPKDSICTILGPSPNNEGPNGSFEVHIANYQGIPNTYTSLHKRQLTYYATRIGCGAEIQSPVKAANRVAELSPNAAGEKFEAKMAPTRVSVSTEAAEGTN